jgi:hypothetical protein
MELEKYEQIIQEWKEENKELIESGKCKMTFLECLPTDINTNRISWRESDGYIVHFIYNDIEGDIIIQKYDTKTRLLYIKYKDNEMEISDGNFVKCKIGKVLKRHNSDFKVEIGKHFKSEIKDIIITNRKYEVDKSGIKRKWYKYKCFQCGFDCSKHYNTKKHGYEEELWMEESHLLNGKSRCACCMNSAIVKGINDIGTVSPNLVRYFKNIEDAYIHSITSHDKVVCICPDCGYEKQFMISNISRRRDYSCPRCGDGFSYPNKMMFNILTQSNINFEAEFTPSWCKYIFNDEIKQGRYDFYINNKNSIIEMDGHFHYDDNFMNEQTSEESKYIDDEKDKLASNNGINKPIRIDCNYTNIATRFEYIKNNIINNTELNSLLDLSLIDWNECEKSLLSTKVKDVCELWNSGVRDRYEIVRRTKLSLSTVQIYLKKGQLLKWCDYDVEQELHKGRFSSDKESMTSRPIAIFKDNIPFDNFNSATDLEKKSIEMFGFKLGHSPISAVCKGKLKQYKGFTFKYVSDLTPEEIEQIQNQANKQAI